MKTFKETQIEKAVETSLLEAASQLGSVTEENKEKILDKGFEILMGYSFVKYGSYDFDSETGEKKPKTVKFDELTGTVYTSGFKVYKRLADFSKIPIKNPFRHKEDWNKFVRACSKLFPNVDGFNAGRCLTTFRQVIENVYFNLGFEGLKSQQICLYQYSALGGTGKSNFYSRLEHFAKKYNLPICHEDVKGRWVGNEFSSNIFGIVNEFFPPKNGFEVEETIKKFNNIVDNELYEVEYKGQDHFYVQSRCTLFVNSNKLPFDGNTRRYGIVNYNEIPFKFISDEDRAKYFPTRTDEEWDEIFMEAFESCPFGATFEDMECKNSENLNDLIFAARKVVKHLSNMPFEVTNATIREFATHYLGLMNDFGKVDPGAVKKQIYIWRNDIRKAVALGQIVPSQRVNGNLDYSKYNFQDIANMKTCEDDLQNDLNDIENPFERTKVAFERFIDPELEPDPDPKKFLEETHDELPIEFFYKADEFSSPSTVHDESIQFVISNPPTKDSLKKMQENREFEKEFAKGENLQKCNFVFEIDPSEEEKKVLKTLPREERVAKAREYIEEQKRNVEKLPQEVKDSILSVTESGADSLHVILHTNNESEESRSEIWKYLSDKYFGGKADNQCSNTSRLTPNPNAIRNRKQAEKPEFVGQRQTCWYLNRNPKAFDVKWIENQVLKDREEAKRQLQERISENRSFAKQELTIENLLKRKPSKARDSAISLLEGNCCHGPEAIGGMMYILSTGWDEYEMESVIDKGTWSQSEYDGMVKAALKNLNR